jgi:Arf-GAP/coiled-coil/ANK repeat/PH domain-containing protein
MQHDADGFDNAPTISDSPRVREELRGQLLKLRTMEASMASFAANISDISASLSKSAQVDVASAQELLSSSDLEQLNLNDIFTQLSDFSENLQHQLKRLVVEELQEYQAKVSSAIKSARAFDDESDAFDSAHQKYLSLSRDSPVETRAYAHGELCDKAAGVALSLFDARSELREGCAALRVVPPRAMCELLVAQLAYHQSCTRLLTSVMPQVRTRRTQLIGRQRAPNSPASYSLSPCLARR